MALQVVSPAVSVYKVTGVKDGVEQTQEYTYHRGELLPDWVTPYQQFVLSQTGMARQVGDFPDPNLRRPEDMPAPVLMPEHSPLAVLGTEVTGPMAVTERVTAPPAAAPASSAPAGELPGDDENKPVWEDFAVNRLGMKRGEAEGMKKADLIKEVKAQYSEQGSGEGKLPRGFEPKADAPAEEPKAEAVTTKSHTDSTTTVKPTAAGKAGK
jgi:hypothetical protein